MPEGSTNQSYKLGGILIQPGQETKAVKWALSNVPSLQTYGYVLSVVSLDASCLLEEAKSIYSCTTTGE